MNTRLKRRQEIVKGGGLDLDVVPDEEISDGGYSSAEELVGETLPHRYRIKKSKFREQYPSIFDHPNIIPIHHSTKNLPEKELFEIDRRMQAQLGRQSTKEKS